MTRQKKLKKAIRARVRKTGERYAAARRQLLAERTRRAERRSPASPSKPAKPTGATAGSGIRDAKVRERTGRSLDQWFELLDRFGAVEKGHTATARHLVSDHGVDGWHAQGITVAYERALGLRAVNQRMDGLFEFSVSKALRVPLERVAAALSRSRERDAWLRDSGPALRKALEQAFTGAGAKTVTLRPGKDAYVRYRAEGTTIELRVLSKTGGRSSIVATVMKIPTASQMQALRSAWRHALESLKAHLG